MRLVIIALIIVVLTIVGTFLRDIYRPYALAAYALASLFLGLLVASFVGWV